MNIIIPSKLNPTDSFISSIPLRRVPRAIPPVGIVKYARIEIERKRSACWKLPPNIVLIPSLESRMIPKRTTPFIKFKSS
jgi:hypothetical protein